MIKLKWLLLSGVILQLAVPLSAHTSTPNALTLAEQFVQGASPEQILLSAIEANTRVDPEFLAVEFYDTRTNSALNRNEIRELMGPVRQDGAYQMMAIALSLSEARLGFEQAQLEQLLDAAFIASMRRPPEHISIEFYDVRTGPTGVGGGVSGSVPDSIYKPEKPLPETSQLKLDSQLLASVMPDSDDELLALFRQLGVEAERRSDQVAIPLVVAARDKTELPTLLHYEQIHLHVAFGVQHIETIEHYVDEPRAGIFRAIQVAYYSGPAEVVRMIERELDGVFYQ